LLRISFGDDMRIDGILDQARRMEQDQLGS